MSSIKITNVRTASAEEWDEHWENCEYATYFHSRTWNEVWEVYSERKNIAEAYLIHFSDGKNAVIPYVYQSKYKGFDKRLLLSPAGTFGGWISKNILTKTHAILLFKFLKGKSTIWRVNPYAPYTEVVDTADSRKDVTNVLPLYEDFDTIFKQWSSNHKRAVKKGLKEGVIVKVAQEDEEWRLYFNIYQKSIKRWGEKTTSSYDWKLFSLLSQLPENSIKLWLSYYNNNVVAGALCFYAQKHVVYWHGAADEEYFQFRPTQILFYECIQHACVNGYKWFDFNPSGSHEGVRKFKRGFATVERESPVIFHNNQFTKNIKRVNWVLDRVKEKLHAKQN